MHSITVLSPAKLNLFLAVTGRREDGFHALVSVVVPLDFGDQLTVEANVSGTFELRCDVPQVPTGEANLVVRAAHAFAKRTGWRGGAKIVLHKRVPMGAGLGGGSSNAAVTLQVLNQLAGHPLDAASLAAVAAQLGSDCPFFVDAVPAVMRGRGEQLQRLPDPLCRRLAGQRVLIFKPAFGIDTAWAYRTLAARVAAGEASYCAEGVAEAKLAEWAGNPEASLEQLLYNNLEQPAFTKFVALPTLLERLRREQGWSARMTGSGSACFGLLTENQAVEPLLATIREAWGDTAFTQACRIAG